MKRKSSILLVSLLLFGTSLPSCKKCKTCYLIEEVNGTTNEFYQGEYCGDEIEEQENKVFHPQSGTTHIECR